MVRTITVGSETGGDGPVHRQRVKSNAPKTGGDSYFELVVMGGAGVVTLRVIIINRQQLTISLF